MVLGEASQEAPRGQGGFLFRDTPIPSPLCPMREMAGFLWLLGPRVSLADGVSLQRSKKPPATSQHPSPPLAFAAGRHLRRRGVAGGRLGSSLPPPSPPFRSKPLSAAPSENTCERDSSSSARPPPPSLSPWEAP